MRVKWNKEALEQLDSILWDTRREPATQSSATK